MVELSSSSSINVSKKRWFVLALFACLVFMANANITMYNLVNNVMITYFKAPYALTDWMELSVYLGTIVTVPFVAWFSYIGTFSCKKLLLISSLMISFDYALSLSAFIFPSLFGLLLFGQILSGIAVAVIFPAIPEVAELWFPESEIGTAIGLSTVGSTLASLFTSIVIPSFTIHSATRNSTNRTGGLGHEEFSFVWMLSILLIFALTVAIVLFTCVPEIPENPPSYAQLLKRETKVSQDNNNNSKLSLSMFAKETKSLLLDPIFTLSSIASGIIFQSTDLEELIMQQMVRKTSFMRYSLINPNVKAGFVIFCYNAGFLISGFVAGKVLDRFKKYHLQTIVGCGCYLVFTVCAMLCINFRIAEGFFIFYFVIGFSACFSLVSLIDSLMQHTYPRNVLFVSSWMNFLQNFPMLFIIVIGRQVFIKFLLIGIMTYLCIIKLVAMIFCIVSKPNTQRLIVEESRDESTSNEETPLVTNEE